MRYLFILFIVFSPLFIIAQTSVFYISSTGIDSNKGTQVAPFKTIHRAFQNLEGFNGKKAKIILESGTYRITNPLLLSKANCRTKSLLVVTNGDDIIISGGVKINSWNRIGKNLWKAKSPLGVDSFRELFINNKRAIRARHPNAGFLRIEKAGEDKRTNFFFEKGDFPIPENEKQTELVFMHDWSATRINLNRIDYDKNQVFAVDTIGPQSLSFFTLDNWEAQPRYFLENDISFLDAENEWYFDTDEGVIYLKSMDDPNSFDIEVPSLNRLIEIKGSKEKPVKNITFDGIQFQYCGWEIPASGYRGIQACHFDSELNPSEWEVVSSAIVVNWGENIRFEKCSFQALGGNGVLIGTGCKKCYLKDCVIRDISGNGIMIGEGQHRLINGKPWWQVAPNQVATANKIINCSISECGQQFYGAVGIWCGLTAETHISKNKIFNLPYTGISIGWMWNPQPTPCRNNKILYNHIHHVLNELSDGGGIYMLGLQPGSILKGNHIHNVELNTGKAESNGMFLDEGTKDVVVKKNLIYNIAKSPLRFHKGSTNFVKSNYLFCSKGVPPVRYNRTEEDDIKKVKNHIYEVDEPIYKMALIKAIKKYFK